MPHIRRPFFYKLAIPADSIARAIAFALEQPADVDVKQIVIRLTIQEFRGKILRVGIYWWWRSKVGLNGRL